MTGGGDAGRLPSHSSSGLSLSSTWRWHPSLFMRHSLGYILRSEAHTGLWGTLVQSRRHEQRGRPSSSTVHVEPYSHVMEAHTSAAGPGARACTGTGGAAAGGGGGDESRGRTGLGSSSSSRREGRELVGASLGPGVRLRVFVCTECVPVCVGLY